MDSRALTSCKTKCWLLELAMNYGIGSKTSQALRIWVEELLGGFPKTAYQLLQQFTCTSL